METVADLDETLGEEFLCADDPLHVGPASLKSALRRVVAERKALPVFVGSALKNTGVQVRLRSLSGSLDLLKKIPLLPPSFSPLPFRPFCSGSTLYRALFLPHLHCSLSWTELLIIFLLQTRSLTLFSDITKEKLRSALWSSRSYSTQTKVSQARYSCGYLPGGRGLPMIRFIYPFGRHSDSRFHFGYLPTVT